MMVEFQKTDYNFLPTPTHTGIRENFAALDAFDLILAFANGAPWESGRKAYCRLAKKAFAGTNRKLAAFFFVW